jgi:enoyl-CoA hydratase
MNRPKALNALCDKLY